MSLFQFIPDVLDGVEARAEWKFFHTKLIQYVQYCQVGQLLFWVTLSGLKWAWVDGQNSSLFTINWAGFKIR